MAVLGLWLLSVSFGPVKSSNKEAGAVAAP